MYSCKTLYKKTYQTTLSELLVPNPQIAQCNETQAKLALYVSGADSDAAYFGKNICLSSRSCIFTFFLKKYS